MNLLAITVLGLTLIQFCYAGENNWVTFVIENHTSKTLYLTDVHLMYGKWYRTACKPCELRTVEQTIGPGSHTLVNAAGRLLSPTGAEAEFTIYDGNKRDTSTTQILHLYFSIPFLVGTENTVNVKPFAPEKYPVEMFGGRQRGTALGVVTLKIIENKDSLVN